MLMDTSSDSDTSRFMYEFNLKRNKVINQCNLNPTDVKKTDAYWIYAANNKYHYDTIDSSKIGKWMLFLSKEQVNNVWSKIKQAITNGDLWHSKVSTCSEDKRETHAIMIYTKDYSDLSDVINVLSYLESSGIKSPHTIIRYKTDQQTRAGVYRGGAQKPWIYTSDTIRENAFTADGNKPTGWNSSPEWRRKRTN